jgi:hypothetical protein
MIAVQRTDPQPMTVDEFLAWRGGVPGIIYELVDGMVRAQDAPSATPGSVLTNLTSLIRSHLHRARRSETRLPHRKLRSDTAVSGHLRRYLPRT